MVDSTNTAPLTRILPLVALVPATARVTLSPTFNVVGSTATLFLYTLILVHWPARGGGVGVGAGVVTLTQQATKSAGEQLANDFGVPTVPPLAAQSAREVQKSLLHPEGGGGGGAVQAELNRLSMAPQAPIALLEPFPAGSKSIWTLPQFFPLR